MSYLKSREVKHFEVDVYDLESLITELFGGSYCFEADVECDNDSITEITVSQKDVDGISEETIDRIKTNVNSCRIYDIMALLVKEGHAEIGSYLIEVSY